MVTTQQDTVKEIRAESERVREYIRGLSNNVMELPTPCELWTVKDVIAHLVWFAETYGGMIARGLRDDLSPPEGFPETGSLKRGESGDLYATASINRGKELGPNLLNVLDKTYEWLNSTLSGIGPEDWGKPCYHTSRLRPVESFLPTIMQELAVHEWEIRSSVGQTQPLSPESLKVFMAKIPLGRPATNSWPWRVPFPPRVGRADPLRYRFNLSGPGEEKFDLVVEGEQTRLEPTLSTPANLEIKGDTSTYLLVNYDRVSLGSAISEAKMTVEGDRDMVGDFECWMSAH